MKINFVFLMFQTPLSPSIELDGSDSQQTTSMLSLTPLSSGMAWMYVNRDGSITYNVQLGDNQELPSFTLVPVGKGRKVVDAQQFTPGQVTNGLATGTLDKLR